MYSQPRYYSCEISRDSASLFVKTSLHIRPAFQARLHVTNAIAAWVKSAQLGLASIGATLYMVGRDNDAPMRSAINRAASQKGTRPVDRG